jgi:xylulose-5-phosphate/fructose-6-phosphate phosphoketolase
MKRLFTQFSFPGGIPSHVAPETPGLIHEGVELGYALSQAYRAAFDNPNLIAACIVRDGEAETGHLSSSIESVLRRPARMWVAHSEARAGKHGGLV